MITQARLKELVAYDPVTGAFTWVCSGGSGGTLHIPGDACGSMSSQGYREARLDGQLYRQHRLAVLWMTGEFPGVGFEVDHINRDRSDNSWANLRVVTPTQNQRHAGHKPRAKRTSRYKWVHRRESRWCAEIRIQRTRLAYKMFGSEVAAAWWADKQARFHQGSYAAINFPALEGYTLVGAK